MADDLVVGFELCYYQYDEGGGHSRDSDKPTYNVIVRSRDGGLTWELEDTDNYVGDDPGPKPLPVDINFALPDFPMTDAGIGKALMSLEFLSVRN